MKYWLAICTLCTATSSCSVLFDEGGEGEIFPEGEGPIYRFDFESTERTQVSTGSSTLSVDLIGPATITDGALDLTGSSSGNFGLALSSEPAAEAYDACLESREMTIAVWVTATANDDLGGGLPARIVTVENDTIETNFTLGQTHSGGGLFNSISVRTGGSSEFNTEGLEIDRRAPTWIFYTLEQSGRSHLTVDDFQLERAESDDFDAWQREFNLSLGAVSSSKRGWQGLIHHFEFYCRALDADEEKQLRAATDPG
jgi:hypothetical protein